MGRVPGVLVLLLGLCPAWAADPLNLYFIDTEGGHATLVVAPSGESLLIDTGHEGYGGRDATRIRTAARDAGVKKIDYLLIASFQPDHIGGIKNILEVLPAGTFLDQGAGTGAYPEAYQAGFAKGKHRVVAPGDTIPMKGLAVTIVAAGGREVAAPGEPNPHCEGVERRPDDDAESVGVVVEFGKFRFVDLGDLTWNQELALLCPRNKVGKADVYLTTRHGAESSKAIWGMAPRVAILNNGPRSGGEAAAFKNAMASPGLEDLWQLHFALANGAAGNAPDALIANLQEAGDGSYLKVSAMADGSFTVLNTRNKYSRKYGPAAR